jgi:hypothetical protein
MTNNLRNIAVGIFFCSTNLYHSIIYIKQLHMKKEIGTISCATIIGCMEIQNDRITSKQFKTKMIE